MISKENKIEMAKNSIVGVRQCGTYVEYSRQTKIAKNENVSSYNP